MAYEFVAVDVETANASRASICQIGVVVFRDGEEVESWSSLVDPEAPFSPMNVRVHGIDETNVRRAPTFPDVAPTLLRMIGDRTIVAHTWFDEQAIRKSCERYRFPFRTQTWLDTHEVSREAWDDAPAGHQLAKIAKFLGIDLNHHEAESDARAAGLVMARAIEDTGRPLAEWVDKLSTVVEILVLPSGGRGVDRPPEASAPGALRRQISWKWVAAAIFVSAVVLVLIGS